MAGACLLAQKINNYPNDPAWRMAAIIFIILNNCQFGRIGKCHGLRLQFQPISDSSLSFLQNELHLWGDPRKYTSKRIFSNSNGQYSINCSVIFWCFMMFVSVWRDNLSPGWSSSHPCFVSPCHAGHPGPRDWHHIGGHHVRCWSCLGAWHDMRGHYGWYCCGENCWWS